MTDLPSLTHIVTMVSLSLLSISSYGFVCLIAVRIDVGSIWWKFHIDSLWNGRNDYIVSDLLTIFAELYKEKFR